MYTDIFKPGGYLHSTSKNLRGLRDNARRRGVGHILVTFTSTGADVDVRFKDGYSARTHFNDQTICRNFFDKRWPTKVVYQEH